MKTKETRKAIKARGCKILSVGYCNAQYLLYYEKPFAYSTRAEGWACDYYLFNDVIISTGYAPIGDNINYFKLRECENKARAIVCDYKIPYEEKLEKLNELLNEFIKGELKK